MGVGRKTIRKGMGELETGIAVEDQFHKRGRKPLEETNPGIVEAIREIVDSDCQIDPKFTSERLYTRLSVSEVGKQLIKKNFNRLELPCDQTIRTTMINLGYKRRKVAKTKPKKK